MTGVERAVSPAARAGDQHLLAPARTSSGYTLPDGFWTSFHETHWEKVGAVIAQPFAAPLASPDESFACLVTASERYRAGDHSVLLEFCIEHAQQLVDIGRYLPERSDESANGYAERITPLIGGRRFGLVVEDVQAYDAALWLRLRDYLRGLFEHTGLPGDCAKATVFMGNYDRTPFGLHRGNSGNFMFVVDGQKRMRTWPDAYFRGKEDLTHKLDYARHNGESIVMDAGPGDVIYWPSDYWHIGESLDSKMSSAVSVALFMNPRLATDALVPAAGMLRRHLPAHRDIPVRPNRMTESSAFIDSVASRETAALRSMAADPAFERALRAGLLKKVTGYGFLRPPSALATRALPDDATIRALPEYPTLWIGGEDDEIVVSANGHALSIAIVVFSISISMAKIFAKRHNYNVDANQVKFYFLPKIYYTYNKNTTLPGNFGE